ncbi:Uncharacterized protein YR821_2223 [Yersinia ruckeri]|uniref:Uncharacterized protein n=1 Tax=Yersinia ruckeri TaxID=29486 RepID=A0A0A8VEK5_YERRU|nr:hypothetical protein yruck0001_10430 [Yersinia ruckeri ATCC 29473]QTD77142.1 Uncharacterized protein YR821_2223 [Yersinia ruckeri]CEK28025.1 hypothetical protein CSF007_11395 [Yersinia ruckeri]
MLLANGFTEFILDFGKGNSGELTEEKINVDSFCLIIN